MDSELSDAHLTYQRQQAHDHAMHAIELISLAVVGLVPVQAMLSLQMNTATLALNEFLDPIKPDAIREIVKLFTSTLATYSAACNGVREVIEENGETFQKHHEFAVIMPNELAPQEKKDMEEAWPATENVMLSIEMLVSQFAPSEAQLANLFKLEQLHEGTGAVLRETIDVTSRLKNSLLSLKHRLGSSIAITKQQVL